MPDRNYKEEYKKFQSSPSSIKKRVKLNKINRDKGTYGNNDGKDNSHVKKGDGTVIVVLKSESSNRGSKGDMPGDSRARGGTNVSVSFRGSRVYQNKHVFTAKSDNEFKRSQQEIDWRKQRDKEIKQLSKNIDKRQIYGGTGYGTATYAGGGKVYKDNPNVRKASSGGIYTRGFDYHGGGPYYGQSGGAAALGAGAFGAGAAGTGNDGTGSGGGGDDKRKDAKIKEKGGTTVNEKRALRKQKKALRKAKRQHGQDSVAYRAQADDLADMQLAVQNDTFTALDNVKPWYKSKKGWKKDEYNRINSAQKQKKKWEKANPDKKWEDFGGDDDKHIAAGNDRFGYYAGMTRSGHRVTKTGGGQAWGGGQSIERGQYSSWARMA